MTPIGSMKVRHHSGLMRVSILKKRGCEGTHVKDAGDECSYVPFRAESSGSPQPGNELSKSSKRPHANTWTPLQGLQRETRRAGALLRLCIHKLSPPFVLIYSQSRALWLSIMSDSRQTQWSVFQNAGLLHVLKCYLGTL